MSALTAPDRALRSACLALLLPLLIAPPTSAHNGAVAIAVPVEGITIDGDLSDWPADLTQYPIEMSAFGAPMRDRDDLAATFRVGHRLRSGHLYVAVEALDQSTIVDDLHPGTWWAQDGCEVYLSPSHTDAPYQYSLYGNSELRGPDVAASVRRTGSRHTYEWRLAMSGTAGMVGFDVIVHDSDKNEPYSRQAWGRRSHKVVIRGMGDLLLDPERAGYLRGNVGWKHAEEGRRVGLVQIRSLADEGWHTMVRTGEHGDYKLGLPAGEYSVAAGYRGATTDALHVRVVEHDTTTAPPLAFEPPPLETRVAAGMGTSVAVSNARKVQAGLGSRNQAFHTYSIVDGLPAGHVFSMHQGRDGALWIAPKEGGVVRYDGTHFLNLTTRSGLPSNSVGAMAEGLDGNMWFAAGGLCRYDGHTLTRFGTTDGLNAQYVRAMAVDSAGALWLGTHVGVTRYDGSTFTHYVDEDQTEGVHSILVDGDRVWFGMYSGVGCLQEGQVTVYDGADGIPQSGVDTIARDRNGDLWFWTQTPVGVVRYDGHSFKAYPPPEGPAKGFAITVDPSGIVWFGTDGDGLRFFDGARFGKLGTGDGLPSEGVSSLVCDTHGNLWVGTLAGVSLYRGDQLRTYTNADFPGAESVSDIAEAPDGSVWFGTWDDGATRFDGTSFTTLSAADGLVFSSVGSLLADREGNVWFGRGRAEVGGEGIARYDGTSFVKYTSRDGLTPGAAVTAIEQGADGTIWVAEDRLGVLRLATEPDTVFVRIDTLPASGVRDIFQSPSGELWVGSTFGTAGLWSYGDGRFTKRALSTGSRKSDWVTSLAEGPTGDLWIGTWGGGLARFDGSAFTHYGAPEGLPDCLMNGVVTDTRGRVWISTVGVGLWVFDGAVFQHLSKRDGLPSDNLSGVHCSRDGSVWVAAQGGLVRYLPDTTSPSAVIRDVVTDRRWGPVSEVGLTSLQDYLAIEYGLEDIGAIRGRTLFQYRLLGMGERWQLSREQSVEFSDLAIGSYRFQLRAIDQALNYSETIEVLVRVQPPYGLIGLSAGMVVALAGVLVSGTLALRRRRERDLARAERDEARDRTLREMEEELQTAHDMQMGLMPTDAPDVQGVRIAGRCVSANQVGGDFYQYFEREDSLTVSLADVTGHAMEAAIPAVMFSGILDNQMEQPKPLPELFQGLNRSLCRSLGTHTFVCLSMVDTDLSTQTMRLSNCGCPYPLHFQATTGEIGEIEVDAYPLGVRPDTEYAAREVSLSPGDYVVLHSDGFSEATNADEALFGFDRTMEVIRQGCSEGLSPEDLIDRLIGEVKAFTGDEPQADDMTCVVVRVEG